MTSIVGFWDRIDQLHNAIYRSFIIVRGDDSLNDGIDAYKVYINGFIHETPYALASTAPPNSVYTRVTSGNYRVVVREYDHQKENRLESNTLYFTVCDDEEITFCISLRDGRLHLREVMLIDRI